MKSDFLFLTSVLQVIAAVDYLSPHSLGLHSRQILRSRASWDVTARLSKQRDWLTGRKSISGFIGPKYQ